MKKPQARLTTAATSSSMTPVLNHNVHIIETVPPGKGRRKKMFILEKWVPDRDIYLVGCTAGLLCEKSDSFELYLAVSRSRALTPRKYLVGLKRNWIFYFQRDVYTFSTGINDLTSSQFFPAGYGVLIKKGQPVYIKVGVVNLMINPTAYDAFCNLYYVEA